MGRRRPRLPAVKVKLLLWAVFFAGLIIIYQDDSVMNAILAFLFVGAIPGSRRSLSPDTVIRAVVVAIPIVVLATIAWLVIRHIRRMNRQAALRVSPDESPQILATPPESEHLDDPAPETPEAHKPFPAIRLGGLVLPLQLMTSAQPVVAKGYRRSRKGAAAAVHHTKAVAPGVMATVVNGAWRWVLRPLGNLVAGAIILLWRLSQFIVLATVYIARWLVVSGRAGLIKGWQAGVRLSVRLSHAAEQSATHFWKWLSPYLWKLDSWLELRTRAIIAWVRKHIRQSDDLSFALDISRRTAELAQNHRVFIALSSVRQKSRKKTKKPTAKK
jgi:hypothetical protein